MQPKAQVVPGPQGERQLPRSAHDQQLKLSQRISGAQLVHVADHQPDLVITRSRGARGAVCLPDTLMLHRLGRASLELDLRHHRL
jgi:hypothetical protein